MSWTRYFRRKPEDDDFAQELQAHLDHQVDENLARGMTAEQARTAALRKFGNRTNIQERIHIMNSFGPLETMWQDLRYAARMLRLNPGFTAAAVLSLALGIGANAALFQLLNALVLRTLPVKDPQALIRLDWGPEGGRNGDFLQSPNDFSYPQWEQFRAHHDAFSGVLAWARSEFNLAPSGEARYAKAIYVSGSFFPVLGIQPFAGRLFSEADDQRGCAPGVVISHAFWEREFAGSATVIGRSIALDGHSLPIIGVTPPDFSGVDVGTHFDVAIPLCAQPLFNEENGLNSRRQWWLGFMGRLKPGVSTRQAGAYLESTWPAILKATIHPGWRADTMKTYLQLRIEAKPGRTGFSQLREQVEDPLLLLLGIAGLVLLIACANLANLLLARATVREREISIRLAIGASRMRVIRQLMSESLLLAFIGCMLGGVFAEFLSRYLLSSFATSNDAFFLNLTLDWRSLLFLAGVAALACLLFGLAPALRATRGDAASAMKASGRTATASRERFGLQRLLVISQISLSLILMVGSLLFVRSFRNLMTLDPGFREQGLLVTWVAFGKQSIPKSERTPLFRRMLEKLRTTPGIDSAALVENPPISGVYANNRISMDGFKGKDSSVVLANENCVSDGYFHTLGTPLLAGRDFTSHDTISSPPVAIVDQTFVRQFLHGQNPVGKTFHIVVGPGDPPQIYQIVGLVKNTKYDSLQKAFSPTFFVADAQLRDHQLGIRFVVHSSLTLSSTITSVRTALMTVDPHSTLDFYSMPTLIHNSTRREDVLAQLSSVFGLLAVVLATVGLYGVMSYMVTQRRNEIGIRLAIGAGRPQIFKMIFRQSGRLLLIGIIVGAGLSLAGASTAKSLLFDLAPYDPATIMIAIVALAAVTFIATLIPARRAANLEPMSALREE